MALIVKSETGDWEVPVPQIAAPIEAVPHWEGPLQQKFSNKSQNICSVDSKPVLPS